MLSIRVFAVTAVYLFAVVFFVAPASAAGLSDLLTVQDGGLLVTEDGAVIENLEIRGTLRIEANNVLVRNVWVYGSEFWSVYVASGSARFENVEIGHASFRGSRGIGGDNIVAIGLDIHDVEDGIKLGSNSTYSGVWVHDLASPSPSPHSDAVQVEGDATNSIVKNSVLSSIGPQGLGNAAVIVMTDLGYQSNISFVNNYMNGGNYTVYVRDGGYGMPTNVSFVNNRFGSSSEYGLTSFDGPVTWENNTWADTGEVIDPSGNVIGQGTTTTTTTDAPSPTTTTTTHAPSPTTTTTTHAPSPTTTTTRAGAAALATASIDPDPSSTSIATSSAMIAVGALLVLTALYLAGTYILRGREG